MFLFCFRLDSTCWGPLRDKLVLIFLGRGSPFAFNRIASAEDSITFPKKQTFWKILHHMVVKIYFCELTC